MNLFFRLFYILLFSRFRLKVELLGPCRTPFMVWLSDLDILRHMNNGRYFSILDLARLDYMIRAGFYQKVDQAGYYPVVVAETIRFRKSLQLHQKFFVESCVLAWDSKAFIIGHEFKIKNEVVANAVIRARFLKKSGGAVSPAEILKLVDYNQESPQLKKWIHDWNQIQS